MKTEPAIVCDNAPIKAYLDLVNGALAGGRLDRLPDLPGKLTRIEHVKRGPTLVIRSYPSDELLECIGKVMSEAHREKA